MMLLPADSYVVINKSIITEIDKKILIDLYQPIIGHNAISFYYTLLNDLEKNSITEETYNHHHLLSIMQLSLTDIKVAREKLEAVGLLKTYVKKDHINNYIYVLYSPLSANEFLNHPILSVVLYNNVGKTEFMRIIENYKTPRINFKDYEDITAKFDDVFTTVPAPSFIENKDLVKRNTNGFTFNNTIDIELLISNLNGIVRENAINKDLIDLICNLSYIYNLDTVTIGDLIKANVKENGTIDKEALRKSCRNYYQFENNSNLPTLIYRKQPDYLKTPSGDTSKKAMMIYTFENANPYQFLKSKYKDGKVVERDLRLLESLLVDLKLTPGVVNVLIDYVLKINNQKLNKNYIETIASQWKRLGIETVEEAMKACKKEHKNLLKLKSDPKLIEKVKEAKVPEWFDKNIEKQEVTEEEQNKLKELLKNYS